MWGWLTLSFLVVFAVALLSISLAWGWVQSRTNARLAEKLRVPVGGLAASPTAILRAPQEDEVLPVRLMGNAAYAAVKHLLDQSGSTLTTITFLFLTVALAAMGVLLGLLGPTVGLPWFGPVALCCLLGASPYLWLTFRRRHRILEFEEQFPDALDFLARAMRAGHAFSVGLELLPDETSGPVSQEFRRVYHEQSLGATLETTLKNLAERVPSVDVKFFVAAVLVQRETGGNLSEILLQLSGVIRERFELKAQVRAASAHGRLTGAVLVVLPIFMALALLIVAPGYLESMTADRTGRYLVVGAIVSQFIGYLVIRRIIHIKV
ncbi:MAG: type II secretion system F family protein [Bryobacteraceae bacterium]